MVQTLDAIVRDGRDGFYGGVFGNGLLSLGRGFFDTADLQRPSAQWDSPLSVQAWGHQIWTVPPPSQGYLALAAARIADRLPLPDDPEDGAWPHLLAEAARWAAHDRDTVLFDGADGAELISDANLDARLAGIDPRRRTAPAAPARGGGTIHLCTADADGMGVSLIQSNAAGWGAHLVVPGTGIFLQDRGIGFTLEAGHRGELMPGRRPLHTLSPALVTDGQRLTAVLGTMGGDIQPQVVLQLLARMLRNGESPGRAIAAPRWTIGEGGFTTWSGAGPQVTTLEATAPPSWESGLFERGHDVVRAGPQANAGHAHVIMIGENGVLAGASDPRALTGAAIGW